ncbi:MAG: MBL fold metallo-hydrolase [Pseudomonadota bacterium]
MRLAALVAFAVAALPLPALASICYAFVEGVPGVRYASLELATAAPEVRISFVGHSTYRIESPEGVVANTDYFGADGIGGVPDIVTMNNAHSTHWTANPNPEIDHVLTGWNPDGDGPIEHKLTMADMTVRNVTTDIRNWGTPREDGNSIFVFEVADLCIGHLGHLHHPLTEQQYALLGRIDILMLPIDGSFTLNLGQMIEIAKRLKSSLVLPMHAFGEASMQRFLSGMADAFVVRYGDAVLDVSIESLPSQPTVLVMPPTQYLSRGSLGID